MSQDMAAVAPPEPRVSDTYALVYAATLLFLVPGSIAIGELPFRTYTPTYVSLVTVPFLLGLIFTFLTDSHDSAKTVALRVAILSPLIIISGVAVMFTSSLLLLPINQFLGPEFRSLTTPLAALLLIGLASPLVMALVRRARTAFEWRSFVQGLVLVAALALVGAVAYMSVAHVGALGDIARKDIMIYIIGGLVWYAPSFGIAAGVWRRTGLV